MPAKELISAIVAGLISSGLFLIVAGIGLGFLFMFLPTLPLFYIGLGKQPRLLHISIITAAIIISVITGPPVALFYLLFFALPAWYIAWQGLHWRDGGSERQWFPIGLIMMNLSLYGCALLALATLYYAGEPGGLPQIIADNIHATFADLQADYGEIIDAMADTWVFLIFPITIWLWGMTLYAHAWVTNRALARQNANQRPDFSVQFFTIPSWMLALLAICALASLIGSDSMRFLGKSALISLMLPYFFLGAAVMHTAAKTWPSHRFFLFFVYFAIFSQFWPALILSAIGLFQQIKHLSAAKS